MKGYTKIAALMGNYPESLMIRQFNELNVQNILYLQAELVGLEQDYRELEKENDTSTGAERARFSLDWYTLSTSKEDGGDNEQWRTAMKIREKLQEYSRQALPQSFSITQLNCFQMMQSFDMPKYPTFLLPGHKSLGICRNGLRGPESAQFIFWVGTARCGQTGKILWY